MLLIDNRILIVHMRKCGGTSFCSGLIDLLPPERLFFLGYTPEGEERSARYRRRPEGVWKHATAETILKGLHLDRKALDIYLLSVRPWWERVASFYFHALRYHQKDPAKYRWVKDMSFSDYLHSEHRNNERITDYACGADGEVLVDHLVPFDDLDGAYGRLCEDLGFPGQKIPHVNFNRLKGKAITDGNLRGLYSAADWAFVEPYFAEESAFLAARGLAPLHEDPSR